MARYIGIEKTWDNAVLFGFGFGFGDGRFGRMGIPSVLIVCFLYWTLFVGPHEFTKSGE